VSATTFVRGKTEVDFPHAVHWPLVWWAVLVGVMVAGEIARLYDVKKPLLGHPATGVLSTSRSSDEPTTTQRARAGEPGRGRHAETPWQIPWRGWKDILWRTYQQMGEDRLLAVAAGVVFYGLLAIFPALTALVSLYGLFASPVAIGDHLSHAAGILPQGTVDILREQIGHLTSGNGKSSASDSSSGLLSRCGAQTPE
jgi:hypothetical protein